MIDLAKRLFINDVPKKVADIGCGSGCLGITLSLELPGIELDMYDIDKFCVATSKQNADILSVNANYYLNDLLKGSEIEYNLILANLPYVPNSHTVNKDAMSEPKHAIFGGPDGLSLYRRLFKQLGNSTLPRHVLTESLPAQHENLSKIARKFGYDLIEIDDFIQCFKKL
jgi:release factor glutamine methyltransferase